MMISLEMLGYYDSALVHNATQLVWNASTPIVVILLLLIGNLPTIPDLIPPQP